MLYPHPHALPPPRWPRRPQVGALDALFAYRMVVVLLRRELPLEQVIAGWLPPGHVLACLQCKAKQCKGIRLPKRAASPAASAVQPERELLPEAVCHVVFLGKKLLACLLACCAWP
jgi:hypothetical protein